MSRIKGDDLVGELKETLAHAKPQFKVVVMPDFYLDYILTYPGKLEDLTASFLEVAQRGGGNLLGWGHTVGRGGNASNVVAQLSKLGCQVVPIIETDELGKTALQHFLKGVDLSHVRTTGTMSRTMSFETVHSGRHVNIMVSDPGSLSQFGPEKLTQEDKQLISEADFVCVLNWNQNLKGTDLAEKVFSMAKEEGKAVTFFDPGDPALRLGEIEGLNQRVLTPGLVDVLSVNENELVHLAKGVAEDTSEIEGAEDPLFGAASVFSMMIPRVDLHTPRNIRRWTETSGSLRRDQTDKSDWRGRCLERRRYLCPGCGVGTQGSVDIRQRCGGGVSGETWARTSFSWRGRQQSRQCRGCAEALGFHES